MTLEEFLKINKITTTEFSMKISCGQPTVSNLCNRKRRPSPRLALRIEQATGGQVTRDMMLYPELYATTDTTQKSNNLTE
jgi:DNA-binding transcriptional regulator YdaS (Cro superfamily)